MDMGVKRDVARNELTKQGWDLELAANAIIKKD